MIDKVEHALLMAAGMFWQIGWSLVLGFGISALLQAIVPAGQMQRALGRGGIRQIALATVAGAASSSCSYASAAIMRTMFKKGAALVASLAFLFASTNLVIELGIILYLLLGWQFMVAEWIGGLILIAVMSVLVKLTLPKSLVDEARHHEETGAGHQHEGATGKGDTWRERLTAQGTRVAIAQNFTMEWRMLWKDLLAGFLIGGIISAFVPDSVWRALFFTDAPLAIQAPANAVIGPIVAMLTFVCSIGNVPLAAVLWAGGASFGGVLAFLYADLIVLPLLDAYRRYFGWRMAAYMGGVFFVTMAIAALVMEGAFTWLHLVPDRAVSIRERVTDFSLNYTFYLNLIAIGVALWLYWLSRKAPMTHEHHA